MSQLTEELASKVLTGLTYGPYDPLSDDPAEGDEALQEWIYQISEVVLRHAGEDGKSLVSAVAAFAKAQSAHVTSHQLDDYIQEHYRGAGFDVGEVLKGYADNDEVGDLGKLYTRLDESDGVDFFDWKGYANSGARPMSGLQFILVPTTGDAHSVFLFSE